MLKKLFVALLVSLPFLTFPVEAVSLDDFYGYYRYADENSTLAGYIIQPDSFSIVLNPDNQFNEGDYEDAYVDKVLYWHNYSLNNPGSFGPVLAPGGESQVLSGPYIDFVHDRVLFDLPMPSFQVVLPDVNYILTDEGVLNVRFLEDQDYIASFQVLDSGDLLELQGGEFVRLDAE